jgi:hypothetical protein
MRKNRCHPEPPQLPAQLPALAQRALGGEGRSKDAFRCHPEPPQLPAQIFALAHHVLGSGGRSKDPLVLYYFIGAPSEALACP